MVFELIESLKQQYTDKYVMVDDTRPELRRFRGITGIVKTVNMSGRALVEFDANSNIGSYDIDLDFLQIIDAPLPKPEAQESAAKPAAEKPAAKPASTKPASTKPAPTEAAAAKPAPAKPKTAKPSPAAAPKADKT